MRKSNKFKLNYGEAIRSAFEYLLDNYPEVFIIGQGLWSPWYVGNSMTDLDKIYGTQRIIDTPVSESACTGAAVGASLAGMRPIVVHPRMDFMLYALDAIVNEAAKWSSMTGGQAHPCVTIRAIINRGGEQGAQHSQALHAWFAHVPGLRVVMPASVEDARDLLIASVLSNDPVVYIDDKWLYSQEEVLSPVKKPLNLADIGPQVVVQGKDLTIVACGHSVLLAKQVIFEFMKIAIKIELVDIRVLNPFNPIEIISSVSKTGRLLVIDPGTKTSGFAAEVIASVVENISSFNSVKQLKRVTLPDAPAPTSSVLEENYYITKKDIVDAINQLLDIKG